MIPAPDQSGHSSVRIAVLGATGRMGTALTRLIAASPDCTLAGAATEPGHAMVGADAGAIAGAGALGVAITGCAPDAVRGCDVAIDFTSASAIAANVAACLASRCAMVIGTTGLDATHQRLLAEAAQTIPLVYGRNMSIGVLVFTELARRAAQLLGAEADIEITDTHHRNKVDAPSGTALQLGEAIAGELGAKLEDVAVFDRFATRAPRRQGSIGFSAVRAGSIVGDHDVLFALAEETILLRHHALDRTTFARGALRAARWIAGRPAKLYGMGDVLGLS
jgi:4-hydroxy-tetrahydrodipicolinate reductase